MFLPELSDPTFWLKGVSAFVVAAALGRGRPQALHPGWLRAIEVLVASAAALAFVLWYTSYIFPGGLRAGMALISDALFAADITIILLGVALNAALKSLLARTRADRRMAAIHGDQYAVPLAHVAVRKGVVPRDELESVEAVRPRARRGSVEPISTILALCGAIVFLGTLLGQSVLSASSPTRSWHVLFEVAWYGGLILAAITGLSGTIDSLLFLPSRISVNSEGITRYPVWGRTRLIRWHDAQFLEVASYRTSQRKEYLRFTLYGQDSRVRWAHPADAPWAIPDRFAQVPLAVIAHTELEPRTFDRSLLAPGASPPMTMLERVSGRLIPSLIYGAIGIGCVALSLILSAPPAFVLILCLVGILLVGGAIAYLVGKWPAGRQSRLSNTARPITSAAGPTLTFSADAVYEAPVGSSPQFRFNQTAFAAIGAGAALFGAGMLGLEIAQYALHVPSLHFYPLPPALVLVLMGFIIGGLAITIIALRAKDTVMLADAHGIRKRWLLGNTFIPWDRVERIELRYVLGRPGFYQVLAGMGATSITWTIHPYRPSRIPQERGAVLITPEQMAALISQRTGKPIQTNEQR